LDAALLARVEKDPELLGLLEEKARRIVRLALKREAYVRENGGGRKRRPGTETQRRLARRAARELMVLLKNEAGLLPLHAGQLGKLAVIGPNVDVARVGGGGSLAVCPERSVSPLEVVRERLPGQAEIVHAPGIRRASDSLPIPDRCWFRDPEGRRPGLEAAYFNNLERRGDPIWRGRVAGLELDWGDFSPEKGVYPSYFSARFEGWLFPERDGPTELRLRVKDGARLWIDGERKLDLISETETGAATGRPWSRAKRAKVVVDLERDRPRHVVVEYANRRTKSCLVLGWQPHDPDPMDTARRAAAEADIVLVFAGSADDEHESRDIPGARLPAGQDDLISEVVAANRRTVVVLNTGTPYLLDRWIEKVPAVLQAWFSGQEGAAATADILLGAASPAGRLPFTYFRSAEDNPAWAGYPPGASGATKAGDLPEDVDERVETTVVESPRIDYTEGLLLGYRGADQKGIAPLFAFGHGLGYTRFEWSDFRVDEGRLETGGYLECRVRVRNVGDFDGAEVVQLYAGPSEPREGEPIKRLAAFAKVFVPAGKTRVARLRVEARELACYDPDTGLWQVSPGSYRLTFSKSAAAVCHTVEIEAAAT